MKTCETCKYWNTDQVDEEIEGLGKCHKVKELFRCTEWTADYDDRQLKESAKDDLAFVIDASGYMAELITKAGFGCNQHENREDQ